MREVAFAYTRFAHHAARAGYSILAEAVAERVPARRLVAKRTLPKRLEHRLLERAGVLGYDRGSLELELAAATSLCLRRGEICHLLYADHVYRYLAELRPAGRLTGGRVVCTYHLPPDELAQILPEPSGLHRADALVALSSPQAEFLSSRAGAERVHLIPHAVDTGFFHPPADGRRDDGTCLFVGAWLRDFAVLRAVVSLTGERRAGLRFRVVTRRERVHELRPLLPCMEVMAGISDAALLESYQRASLFICPLLDATANNALLEALACGLPAVITDVGGVRDYVDDSCAVLVPPDDAEAMGEAVLSLAADSGRLRKLSLAARERALELDLGPIAERQIEVYRAIAA